MRIEFGKFINFFFLSLPIFYNPLKTEEFILKFTDRPRYLYTKQEIERIKQDPAKKLEIELIIKNAENFLKNPIKIPEKEGGWIWDYYCPKDGTLLSAESEVRHICRLCNSVYTDEKVVSAYRTHINYLIDKTCVNLAKAYIFTGEEKYAITVKDILLKIASLYPKFQRHDRWGRKGILAVLGGRRYAQNLDEAISAIDLASAYDLVANSYCFTEKDKEIIENFLKNIVKEIMKYQIFHGGKSNHQTWFNASYAIVGLVTGDRELIKESIYGKYGFLWQLENSVTSDGFWYEGTISYHFYALDALQKMLDACKRLGIYFRENEKLKKMWLSPILISYPNGMLPAFNDSDPLNLNIFRSYFHWAYDYFGDKIFSIYSGLSDSNEDMNLKSVVLSDIGFVVLRKGFNNNKICVILDYGPHGNSHGHFDKLNIVLFAKNREILPDRGRGVYSMDLYKNWYKKTLSHNTIVINEKDQNPASGKLIFFQESDNFSSCLVLCTDAYPGYNLKRALLLTDNYLVDIFTIKGEKKSVLDWFIHFYGQIKEIGDYRNFYFEDKRNGYENLKDCKLINKINDIMKFTISLSKDESLNLFLLNGNNSNIIIGTGLGYNINDKVNFLLNRKIGNEAIFIGIYDFNCMAKDIKFIPVFEEEREVSKYDAIGIKIFEEFKAIEIGVSLTEEEKVLNYNKKHSFKRIYFNEVRN
ncbi:MAG: alginate lyase family protein [Thermoplasmata archaeon]